jgi:hypothetical protein
VSFCGSNATRISNKEPTRSRPLRRSLSSKSKYRLRRLPWALLLPRSRRKLRYGKRTLQEAHHQLPSRPTWPATTIGLRKRTMQPIHSAALPRNSRRRRLLSRPPGRYLFHFPSQFELQIDVRSWPRLCKNANSTSPLRRSTFQNARYGVFARSGMVKRPVKTRPWHVFTQPGPNPAVQRSIVIQMRSQSFRLYFTSPPKVTLACCSNALMRSLCEIDP